MRCDPPSDEDVTTLVAAMVERARASLCRRGLLDADDGEVPPPDAQLLLQCAAADPESVTCTVQKARPGKGRRKPKPLCAGYGGTQAHVVLGATGFQSHSMDGHMVQACRRPGIPYVRVHRDRRLACILAISRELGLGPAS